MRTTVVLVGIWIFTLWGPAWTKPAASAPPDLPAFPRWQPPPAADHPPEMGEPDLHGELTSLYRQGLRDQAAGPEFLQAMKRILDRYAPSRLPFREDFTGGAMAPGWQAVRDVWALRDGYVSQTEFRHNTRFMLYYAPGRQWRNYAFTGVAWADPYPAQQSDLRLYFRWQDPDNAYFLQCFHNGQVRLGIRQHGAERILASALADPKRAASKAPWKILAFQDSLLVLDADRVVLAVSDSTFPSGTIAIEAIHLKGHFTGIRVDPL
ncbi:MAG: hypothetical protein PHR34_00725 [Kiritimatiellae bacterium]|nr:hypothetical protein [Kiritimatiellia bacterium]